MPLFALVSLLYLSYLSYMRAGMPISQPTKDETKLYNKFGPITNLNELINTKEKCECMLATNVYCHAKALHPSLFVVCVSHF